MRIDLGQHGIQCAMAHPGAHLRQSGGGESLGATATGTDEKAAANFLKESGVWEKADGLLVCVPSFRYLFVLNPRCLQWLVEHGADTTTPDLNGNTPQQSLGWIRLVVL